MNSRYNLLTVIYFQSVFLFYIVGCSNCIGYIFFYNIHCKWLFIILHEFRYKFMLRRKAHYSHRQDLSCPESTYKKCLREE